MSYIFQQSISADFSELNNQLKFYKLTTIYYYYYLKYLPCFVYTKHGNFIKQEHMQKLHFVFDLRAKIEL